MYARTIVLELVKRADEAAKREEDDAQHETTMVRREEAAADAAVTAASEAAPGARGANPPGVDANLFPEDESAPVDVRVMSRTLNWNGSIFDWWVLGEGPALVTVHHASLGKVSGFTEEAPEAFALGLAKQLVDGHTKDGSAAAPRSAGDSISPPSAATPALAPSALKMPGWFEK